MLQVVVFDATEAEQDQECSENYSEGDECIRSNYVVVGDVGIRLDKILEVVLFILIDN